MPNKTLNEIYYAVLYINLRYMKKTHSFEEKGTGGMPSLLEVTFEQHILNNNHSLTQRMVV